MPGYISEGETIIVNQVGFSYLPLTVSEDTLEVDPFGFAGIQINNTNLGTIALHSLTPPVESNYVFWTQVILFNGSDDPLSTITIKNNSDSVENATKRIYTATGSDFVLARNRPARFLYVTTPSFQGWQQG